MAISQVTVSSDLGDTTYATREGVETQTLAVIALRYKTARGAPILQNEDLFRDFGYLANTEATLQVLQGTYKYPELTDRYTKVILQEARKIYNKLPNGEVSDFISRDEYKQYWRYGSKEKTQSSASGVHKGHYKASSYDNDLSTLEAANSLWPQPQVYHLHAGAPASQSYSRRFLATYTLTKCALFVFSRLTTTILPNLSLQNK